MLSFKKTIIIVISTVILSFCIFFLPLVVIIGTVIGDSVGSITTSKYDSNNYYETILVKNSYVYADKYKKVLNEYLTSKGYVSLERMVFYLQRTNNVLNVSELNIDKWQEAYIKNINENEKQMIPITEVCNTLSKDKSLPNFNIKSGNDLDVIDLCYNENLINTYINLPFSFPLHSKFTITSFTNEGRILNNGKQDIHNGWDFAVPIGTNFYSICDGVVSKVGNTQVSDIPSLKSPNDVGNHIIVKCNNSMTAFYYHLKYNTIKYKVGEKVKSGDVLGKTSTTGYSTGPHLHLGLKDSSGQVVDPMNYIDIKTF